MTSDGCQHLYVHVPFCSGKCSYCGFYSERYESEAAEAYMRALVAELDLCNNAEPLGAPTTVYFGGGTPSVLSLPQLARLFAIIHERVDMHAVEEWTVECNPGTVTREKAREFRRNGVTRVSLGAQAMTDRALAALGRNHGTRELERSVEDCRSAGFTDVALDLIAGLPECGEGQWLETLGRTLELRPTHLSVYALTVEDGTRLAQSVQEGSIVLPGEDAQLQALETAERELRRAGFERYEISNYALPGRPCRHNMAYWQGHDYLGVGPSAASRSGYLRWTNAGDLPSYTRSLAAGRTPPREEETVEPLTDTVERLVFGLRLAEGIREAHVAELPVAAEWLATLRRMAQEGLVEADAGRWLLTRRGRELADAVVRELMVTE